MTNPNDVFLSGSQEAIWQLMPATTSVNTWEGNVFIPSATVIPSYPVTTSLYNSIAATDQRRTAWLKGITVGTTTYYYPNKYKVRTGTSITEYYMVLRLAELYLIRAEARANQNKLPEAIADLNTVHKRAGLVEFPNTLSKTETLDNIEKERRVELMLEWGHRWLDLKRTHRSDAVLGSLKSGWQATDTLYPIPAYEIQANPSLSQNIGYQ